MKILLLTQWFDPEPCFKGLPFARQLARRGDSVEILTGFPNYPDGEVYPGYRVRPWQVDRVEGFRVCRVALYPSHDRSALRRSINYVSFALASAILGPFLVHRPDVIYVYHPPGTIGLPALLLRSWFSVPVIYDVQDLWPDTIAATGMVSSRTALSVLDYLCRFVYRHADQLVVLSPGFRRALIDRGVPENRIQVIYNWAPDDALATSAGPSSSYNKRSDEFRVVFAGTMGFAQALDAVLQSAAQCAVRVPQARFVFVGGGVDRNRLQMEARNRRLDNVEFISRQPPSAMRAIFDQADALLVHLKDDPLFAVTIPGKTQAYLASGRPLIMAVRGDAARLVERANAGVLAEPEDPTSITAAVEKLASLLPEDRERMGAAGRAFYQRELAIDVAVDQFRDLFHRLTKAKSWDSCSARITP
ncbi:MAG: glycosyltransferase family 4 protein [Acidobacteriaceae bacterium]|jgi:colanic acid biosynthesis glycosyl transferase WcaI